MSFFIELPLTRLPPHPDLTGLSTPSAPSFVVTVFVTGVVFVASFDTGVTSLRGRLAVRARRELESSFETIARAGESARPTLASLVRLTSREELPPPILPPPRPVDRSLPVPRVRPPDPLTASPSNTAGDDPTSTPSLSRESAAVGLLPSLPLPLLFARPLNAALLRSPPHVPLLIFDGGRCSLSLSLPLSLLLCCCCV